MTDQKFLDVTDTSATSDYPVREHFIKHEGEIKGVTFEYGKPTRLPFDVGSKFLIPGFIVTDSDGLDVNAPPLTNDAVRFQIGEDEVIAKYEELTIHSLQLRAVKLEGGEQFVDATDEDRAAIITFLKLAALPHNIEDEDVIELEDEDGETADVDDNASAEPIAPLPEFTDAVEATDEEDEIIIDENAPVDAPADKTADGEEGNADAPKEEGITQPEDKSKEA